MSIKLIVSFAVLSFFLLGNVETIQNVFAETENENFTFFLDNAWYDPRDNIRLEGWVNTVDSPEIRIEIINPNNIVVVHQKVPLQETYKIDHTISTFGGEWNVFGFYQIKISYSDETQTRLFAFGNFNSQEFRPQIKLDQEVYSWMDTVKIMIISPNDNQNNNQKDEIKIKISSDAGTLSSYTLEETGLNHGVFSGIVTLSGHSDFDINQDGVIGDLPGYTSGVGPKDGKLSVYPHDRIKVIFSTPFFEETLKETAIIQFHKAIVEWADPPIYPNQKTIARVIDPDMKIYPEVKEKVKVLVWSYLQKYPKEYTLLETERNSGVFEGLIEINSKSLTSGLFAPSGSTVYIMYEDKTLPQNYTAETLKIITNATIAKQVESEETLSDSNFPQGVKDSAKWWSEDVIGDDVFLQVIRQLIDEGIIKIQTKSDHDPNKTSFVPNWIKNSAQWWAQGQITDDDFLKGIQYLVEQGIIKV